MLQPLRKNYPPPLPPTSWAWPVLYLDVGYYHICIRYQMGTNPGVGLIPDIPPKREGLATPKSHPSFDTPIHLPTLTVPKPDVLDVLYSGYEVNKTIVQWSGDERNNTSTFHCVRNNGCPLQ